MPCCNTAPYKRLQRVLFCKRNYTANTVKKRTGIYRGISCNLTHSSAHSTAATQANYAPPAARWSVSQRRSTSTDTRYQRHAGRCTGQHSRPIIIRYIRVQHIADHASPAGSAPIICGSLASAAPGAPAERVSVSTCTGSARRLAIWHRVNLAPSTRRGSPEHGCGGQAEPLEACSRISFRAFAR